MKLLINLTFEVDCESYRSGNDDWQFKSYYDMLSDEKFKIWDLEIHNLEEKVPTLVENLGLQD